MKLLISLILRAPQALIYLAVISGLLFSPATARSQTEDDQTQAHGWALIRARQEKEVPVEIRNLKNRKLFSYKSKKSLLSDALKINDYFESDVPSKKERDQFAKRLKSFVTSARTSELDGESTLEEFVVHKRVDFLAKPQSFSKLRELLEGPHLKGLSRLGILAAVGSITYLMLKHVSLPHQVVVDTHEAAFAFGGFLLGTLRAGPAAQIMNAMVGWFLTPTMEMIKVFNSRYTGKIEERINRFYDRFKPKKTGEVSERNERPKIANVNEDGTDFAGMSEEDQIKNWDKSMAMWVALAKRYGQLLRDTHHSGRFLMLMSWTDEQAAATLIETVATKMLALDVRVETMLTPHETAFLLNGERDKKERLEALVREYQSLCKSMWVNPNATTEELEKASGELDRVKKDLHELGLSLDDLDLLSESEVTRAKAIGAIVTAVALNEMRLYSSPEANRNLADGARVTQRAIRFGLNLQDYTDNHKELVRHQIRLMGYDHEGRTCDDVLSKSSK